MFHTETDPDRPTAPAPPETVLLSIIFFESP